VALRGIAGHLAREELARRVCAANLQSGCVARKYLGCVSSCGALRGQYRGSIKQRRLKRRRNMGGRQKKMEYRRVKNE